MRPSFDRSDYLRLFFSLFFLLLSLLEFYVGHSRDHYLVFVEAKRGLCGCRVKCKPTGEIICLSIDLLMILLLVLSEWRVEFKIIASVS